MPRHLPKQHARLERRQAGYLKSLNAKENSFDMHKPGSQNRNKK